MERTNMKEEYFLDPEIGPGWGRAATRMACECCTEGLCDGSYAELMLPWR